MGLLEQQNFLAKLYTDDNFRQKFVSDPTLFGKENNLNKQQIDEIIEILPDEINAFAESLFYKRLREVERMLPWTRKELNGDFEFFFREFIKVFNPQTVKKHFEDAIHFADFLQEQKIEKVWIKDLVKLEQAKLEFAGLNKSFIIRKFDYDLRKYANGKSDLLSRETFAIWVKIGKFHRHYIL